MSVSLCPLVWLPRYPSTLTADRRVNKNAGHMHPRRKEVPPKIPRYHHTYAIHCHFGQASEAVSMPTYGEPTHSDRRGRGGSLCARKDSGLPPPNPFLCRRRKKPNHPTKLDGRLELTSTMSPTLNFDSVLARAERRRRRLMVGCVAVGSWVLLYLSQSVLVLLLSLTLLVCSDVKASRNQSLLGPYSPIL